MKYLNKNQEIALIISAAVLFPLFIGVISLQHEPSQPVETISQNLVATSSLDTSTWKTIGGDTFGFTISVPQSVKQDLVYNPVTEPHGDFHIKNSSKENEDYFDLLINSNGEYDFGLDDAWYMGIVTIQGNTYPAYRMNDDKKKIKSIIFRFPQDCSFTKSNCYEFIGTGDSREGWNLLLKSIESFKFIDATSTIDTSSKDDFEYGKDFTLSLPSGWALVATTSDSLRSGFVRGNLLKSYTVSLPEIYNGPYTSIDARVNIFSEDKLAGYNYNYYNNQAWIYYSTQDKTWYGMDSIDVDDLNLDYKKDKPVNLSPNFLTNSQLPVFSDFGYGDAGCNDSHNLIHVVSKYIIVDMQYSSCYDGSMIDDTEGVKADEIFSNFKNQWSKTIKSFHLLHK